MGMMGINPVEEKEKGKSALETFASAMGILSSLGSLGIQGFNAANAAELADSNIAANNAQMNSLYRNPFPQPLNWENR